MYTYTSLCPVMNKDSFYKTKAYSFHRILNKHPKQSSTHTLLKDISDILSGAKKKAGSLQESRVFVKAKPGG